MNTTVMWLTTRALLSRKRSLLFALPGLVLLAITIGLRAGGPAISTWRGALLGQVGMTTMLPLTAVIIGTTVLGAEIDDGSILHLLTTPLRRGSIVVTKFVVATALVVLFAVVPEFLAGVIASSGVSAFSLGLLIGALVGAIVYSALFVMLSVLARRAVAIGLVYVLVWESLLGARVSGVRLLSAGQYALGIANSISHDGTLGAHLTLGTAAVMAAIVTAAALWLAMNRLRSFRLTGEA